MTGPFMILFVPTDYESVNTASSGGKLVELMHLAARPLSWLAPISYMALVRMPLSARMAL